MGFFSKLISGSGGTLIDAVGKVVDNVHTSDAERAAAQASLEQLRQIPSLAQIRVNEIEAGHRTVFVAGWRPALGWVCALALLQAFVFNPNVQWLTGDVGPVLQMDYLMELVLAMLGLGTLRTFEKVKGVTS